MTALGWRHHSDARRGHAVDRGGREGVAAGEGPRALAGAPEAAAVSTIPGAIDTAAVDAGRFCTHGQEERATIAAAERKRRYFCEAKN